MREKVEQLPAISPSSGNRLASVDASVSPVNRRQFTAIPLAEAARPRVSGKFLFAGSEKLYVRGVTYGAFRPDHSGKEYHDLDLIERDFAQMAAHGVNAVRIPHTVPPRSLLDAAQRHGLRVMVGLSAEQYVGFLIDTRRAPDIEKLIRAKVQACAGHPALLCYSLGNEIPAAIARWLGRRRVERYLERLSRAVRDEDPGALITYVNYPTTEYLQLPFLDFVCFNVYLETQARFESYLARLHNVVGDRPLILSELGLDSLRHGDNAQADSLDWQVRAGFAGGCAGVFVFAWTDEWHRAGADVNDWAFGITSSDRRPKLALQRVREAFAEVPFAKHRAWPRISVVVCSCNGARTIRECFEALTRLEYPSFEVIVVNDGSTDTTARIAREFGFHLISTNGCGLSSARNMGLAAASGQIVAYIDDDAYPDPHWLTYLAATFLNGPYVGVGGPNIHPPTDGWISECVANAPGGPVHVLLSDRDAEHLPGCNMAFDRAALLAVGGFDPQFRTAGDDVDVCWRLQQRGGKLGFSPAAVVWHHRRNSIRAYVKQQSGYGRAEALLERKWPEKYNSAGHITWGGRVYAPSVPSAAQIFSLFRARIYQGTWGSAPFQSLSQPAVSTLWSVLLMPEWYLFILLLTTLAALISLGTWGGAVIATTTLLAVAVAVTFVHCGLSAAGASLPSARGSRVRLLAMRSVVGFLHLVQPLARLYGRVRHGLTPWRARGPRELIAPRRREFSVWSKHCQAPEERLLAIEAALRADHAAVIRGGAYDRWDLEVRGGIHGAARLLMAVEDHGAGRQLVRVRSWPRCRRKGLVGTAFILVLAVLAALTGAWMVFGVLAAVGLGLALRTVHECATALAAVVFAVSATQRTDSAEYSTAVDALRVEREIKRNVWLDEPLLDIDPGIAAGSRRTPSLPMEPRVSSSSPQRHPRTAT